MNRTIQTVLLHGRIDYEGILTMLNTKRVGDKVEILVARSPMGKGEYLVTKILD